MSTDPQTNTDYVDSWSYDEEEAYSFNPSSSVTIGEIKLDVDEQLDSKEATIERSPTEPLNPADGTLWLNTSVVPNSLTRWDGTQWVKVTPVVPEDIGATTEDYVNQQISQIEAGGIPVSATPPTSPVTDDLWVDTSTTPNSLKRYNGTSWVAIDKSSFASLTGTIAAAQISAATITGGMIAGTTITAANIAVGAITANEISANTITGAKIAARTIDAVNIKTGAITANEIAANTITSNLISTVGLDASVIKTGTLSAITINGVTITGSTFVSGAGTTSTVTINSTGIIFDSTNSSGQTALKYDSSLPGLYLVGDTKFSCGSVHSGGNVDCISLQVVGTIATIDGFQIATQNYVTSRGYITSSALSNYTQSNTSVSFSSLSVTNTTTTSGLNVTGGGTVSFGGGLSMSGSLTMGYQIAGSGGRVKFDGSEIGMKNAGDSAYVACRASSFPTGSSIVFKDNLEKIEDTELDPLYLVSSAQIWKYHLKENLAQGIYDKPKIGVISEMSDSIYRDENGVDPYSMVSISWAVLQELLRRDALKEERIKTLEEIVYAS